MTYLGLCRLVLHLAEDEEGDVVLSLLFEYVVCHSDDLDAFDLEACLLEGFALSAHEDALTIVEMAARELPGAYVPISLCLFV